MSTNTDRAGVARRAATARAREFVAAQRDTPTGHRAAGSAGGVMPHHDFATDPDSWTGQDTYPDGWGGELRKGRRDRCPAPDGQRPTVGRRMVGPVESGGSGSGSLPTPADSCAGPLPGLSGHPGGTGGADGVRPPAGQPAGDPVPVLFTPTQAADLLQVPESWLRRRAARRLVPCTFLGKHLRFSRANLDQIVTAAARPATTSQRAAPDTGAVPRRRGRPRARPRVYRPDPGTRPHSPGG